MKISKCSYQISAHEIFKTVEVSPLGGAIPSLLYLLPQLEQMQVVVMGINNEAVMQAERRPQHPQLVPADFHVEAVFRNEIG